MKILSIVRVDESTGQKPTERFTREMGVLLEELIRSGTLIRTSALRPTREGFRMRSNHGKLSATEGPFTETKEVIAGYAILEVPSMEEARKLMTRFLEVHGDEWNVECEVRQLDGTEFGP